MNLKQLILKIFLSATLCLMLSGCKEAQRDNKALARLVDPLIGTDWVGNTYPGANAPFGMVQLSPDNGLPGWDRISGYYYPDSTIAGFSHTHLSGTGAGDMYDISFLPITLPAEIDTLPLGIHAKFDHSEEEAHAGYYRVRLKPYDITVELTVTERMGIQRYTFNQASDSAVVILNLDKAMNWDRTLSSQITIERDQISGYRYSDGWARNQRVYFFSKLSKEPRCVELDSLPHYEGSSKQPTGYGYIARLHYAVAKGDTLLIETALSGVSLEGAHKNYQHEALRSGFDGYLRQTESLWNKHLGTLDVSPETPDSLKRTFYTALYHAQLCPTLYSDVDGRYLAPNRAVKQAQTKRYSTFSLWDTYRSSHPLFNIILPETSADMVASLVDFGIERQGVLPVWNMWASETDMMIGHHSLPVIAAALEAGIYKPKDKGALRNAVITTLNRRDYRGMEDYRRLGYVPADRHKESLSLTLEYAYDDWAGARILKYLGYTQEAKTYYASQHNYRHVWDKTTGFFRPRLSDGAFKQGFDPYAYTEDVTESNAYHYLWSVQQAPDSLIALMGGAEKFSKRLDHFFETPTPRHIKLPIFSTGMIGQYVHGNEPDHHVPFLYHYARQPWKTARLVHRILNTLYSDRPDGLCGNEDCGQMSAWFVLATIGLYPVEASNDFLISSPIFDAITIAPLGGRPFTIKAKGLSQRAIYIKSVKLNGKPWHKAHLTLSDLQRGGELELEMTDREGEIWY